MGGMAKPEVTPKAVAKESALLKCESCKNVQRVWLNKCKACRDPEDNWYEDRIAELEAKVESQDKQIRALVDKLHSRENNG